MKLLPLIVTGALVFLGAFMFTRSMGHGPQNVADGETGDAIVAVNQPATLSDAALAGKATFEANCAKCHGANGSGRLGMGPPLIHKIYEPSHHGDASFQSAVKNGVRGHHWPFGDMPPVEGVSEAQVALITTYIREVQAENGIN